MRDVHAWVGQPTAFAAEMQRHLRTSPEPTFEADLAQFVDTNTNTRTSISTTIMPALQWLGEPTAALAAGQRIGREPVIDESGVTLPDDQLDGATPLDVEALLYQCGTVYLLGAQEAQVAPLVTAFTGHVARTARQIAGRQPGGRLDPQLTLDLDEVALICPIPLDEWSADMGGRNVSIHVAAQSRPQLRKRWGHDGAAAILNNAATVVIFGGTRDPDDLQAYSTLAGEREERTVSRDNTGRIFSESTQRVPVLTPAQIAQLKAGRVLVIRRGMPPVIGMVTMAWQRRDVRAVKRAEARIKRAEKRAVVWARRRQTWARCWGELTAAVAEIVEEIGQAVQEWREQRRERAEQRARDVEAERSRHERIDPQPAGPDQHVEPDLDETGEPGDGDE
jgi:type IV secretory pathway TraG/TraD family ATPase VirD4